MPEEVFIRIQKSDTGAVTAIRLVVLGKFNYEPVVCRFPYPVRDSVANNSFINLRVFDAEISVGNENNVLVPAQVSKNADYSVINIDDPEVLKLAERYKLVHVDLPVAPGNMFPDPTQYGRDLNNNPPASGKDRFEVYKTYNLDHGQGGTSGSAEP